LSPPPPTTSRPSPWAEPARSSAEPPRPDFVLGLDLGQAKDYTALAALKRSWRPDPEHEGRLEAHYACLLLKRWPLGTPYTVIVPDVVKRLAEPPLPGSRLAVDQTGVGAAVVDMLAAARPDAVLHPILITAGHEVAQEKGVHHVPKKELVSVLQVLLQTRRLKVANLPEREVLLRELLAFRVKVAVATGNETFEAWRERDHDDLVLAVALACWLGESVSTFTAPAPVYTRSRTVEERAAGPSGAQRRGMFGLRG
jgi:hypothetical protein